MATSGKYGRTETAAYQLTAERLLLGGRMFTGADLLRRPTQHVLVQPEPTQLAPAAPAVDDQRLAQLEQALSDTRAAIESTRQVQLERTAVKRNRHYYIAGRRVNASDLLGNSNRYFAIARYSTISEALQSLANEVDALHANRPLADSSESSNSN